MTIAMEMAAERNKNITQTIRAISSRLLNFIRQRVTSAEDAEDILQDVFYQFAGNPEPIEQTTSWLYKVARNKIIDNYRKHKLPLADDVLNTVGELKYGLSQPDAKGRTLSLEEFPAWLAEARKQGSVGVIMRVNSAGDEAEPALMPKDSISYRENHLVFLLIPQAAP